MALFALLWAFVISMGYLIACVEGSPSVPGNPGELASIVQGLRVEKEGMVGPAGVEEYPMVVELQLTVSFHLGYISPGF